MQKKHILQNFLKTPLKITLLFEIKNSTVKNIAKKMHFMQKKCKCEKYLYIFEPQYKTKKNN
ncbi:hypothetical protein B0A72_21875 [Flavobacterium pectinovorum]|uniref:Uncharacterized protein n=1 Tax=Flavobacterium pectinovorum TaxID=29533 RepID=A0AB36NVD6_9FLAO|nr:hypothetical protein B0A72_21875 [Flavobacterium pectinovorum]